jgi:CTP:molybdopterin cytidylyltransferase MocA
VRTTLLVVAAGRGERVGGPKALLLIDGQPLAELHARSHEHVVIVTTDEIRRALGEIASFVPPDRAPELGAAGSIGAAVRSGALDDAEGVLITPVDVLPAPTSLRDSLLAALTTHEAARPARGHPVAVRGSLLRKRYRSNDPILREVLDSASCARLQEPGVLDDLDTPEDVVRITGAAPRFLEGLPRSGKVVR